MTDVSSPLRTLAARHGISACYRDTLGKPHEASDATVRAMLTAIGVDAGTESAIADAFAASDAGHHGEIPVARSGILDLPFVGAKEWRVVLEDGIVREGKADGHLRIAGLPNGLHDLSVATASGVWSSPLPVPPARAPSARDLTGRPRHWGIAAPVYGLPGPLGLGTYRALGDLAEGAGGLGASYALVNPVHALFPGAPAAYSPYSPSHRRFFNIAHIDPTTVPELGASPEAQALLHRSEGERVARDRCALIDYAGVAGVLLTMLDALFAAFSALPEAHPRRRAFEAWRRERGAALERYVIYEALAGVHGPFWTAWPAGTRDADALEPDPDLIRRATPHAYFQWLAETQLADAHARARAGGMALGLMLDLAVGVRADGAEVWAEPRNFARGVSIGAPPDAFNPSGQNWALAPLNPRAMRTGGLRAFAETLRASMRHAGALRVDHVLGLSRNFWIADETGEGAYIRFPQEALFAVTAIEADRSGCLAVGEDLGNVPAGFRDEMAASGLYGCRVLYFQRMPSGAFVEPEAYVPATVASIGSHDLATLREWWAGTDLDEMAAAGILKGDTLAAARARREKDRRHLRALLGIGAAVREAPLREVHELLAASGSDLMTVQLENVLPDGARLNLPGTTVEYPNWRRTLPSPAAILGDASLRELAAEIGRIRGAG